MNLPFPQPYYITLKKSKDKSTKPTNNSPPQLTDDDIKDMVENSGETPRKKSKDSMDQDYDPASAGQGFGGDEDEGSISLVCICDKKFDMRRSLSKRSLF